MSLKENYLRQPNLTQMLNSLTLVILIASDYIQAQNVISNLLIINFSRTLCVLLLQTLLRRQFRIYDFVLQQNIKILLEIILILNKVNVFTLRIILFLNLRKIMRSKQKRVESMLNQLYDMHQQLFGHKYAVGIQLNQQSEFNKIIQAFRQLVFLIRHTQQQRLKRYQNKYIQARQNKKNYHESPEGIRINYQIREDIQRAEGILTQAVKRAKTDTKRKKNTQTGKGERATEQLIAKRQKIIENCFQLLKDVRQTEQGGIYQPPTYQTLNDIKKQLIGKDYESVRQSSINIQQEQFFDQVNVRDKQIDKHLDQIIQVNQRVKQKMTGANKAIDEVHEKVIKATKKTEALNQRVRKDEKDLLEILKTYRRPNQLCLDITLVLMVLALIGVVINLVKNM